jgi:hypothetical protein
MHQPFEDFVLRSSPKCIGNTVPGEKWKDIDVCPECGERHPDHITEKCHMVRGRRGWRQLGVYDG